MPRFTEEQYRSHLAREATWREGRELPEPIPSNLSLAVVREEDLHDQISEECRRRNWVAFHGSMVHRTHRTMGEPDYIILRDGGRLLMVECKSRTGKRSTAQLAMAVLADRVGHTVHVVRSFSDFLSLIA